MEDNRIRKRINFTLAEDTLDKLDEVAKAYGSSRSKLIDIAVESIYIRYQKGLPLKDAGDEGLR